jgi:hypothetical protein
MLRSTENRRASRLGDVALKPMTPNRRASRPFVRGRILCKPKWGYINVWVKTRGSRRDRIPKGSVPVNAKMAKVTHRLSQLSLSTILDQKIHTTIDDTRKGGMQGPYTVCKEHPAKGAGNTARTPNTDRKSEWVRNAGPDVPSGKALSTLPGELGNSLLVRRPTDRNTVCGTATPRSLKETGRR